MLEHLSLQSNFFPQNTQHSDICVGAAPHLLVQRQPVRHTDGGQLGGRGEVTHMLSTHATNFLRRRARCCIVCATPGAIATPTLGCDEPFPTSLLWTLYTQKEKGGRDMGMGGLLNFYDTICLQW